MATAHFCVISLGHIFRDFIFLHFFTRSVRLYRRKLVTADGGFLNSTSGPLSYLFLELSQNDFRTRFAVVRCIYLIRTGLARIGS